MLTTGNRSIKTKRDYCEGFESRSEDDGSGTLKESVALLVGVLSDLRATPQSAGYLGEKKCSAVMRGHKEKGSSTPNQQANTCPIQMGDNVAFSDSIWKRCFCSVFMGRRSLTLESRYKEILGAVDSCCGSVHSYSVTPFGCRCWYSPHVLSVQRILSLPKVF